MDDSDRLSALHRDLAERLGVQRYELWIGQQTVLEYDNQLLRVGCASQFECQWLRSRLNQTLLASCKQVWGTQPRLEFYVSKSKAAPGKSQKQTKSGSDTVQAPGLFPQANRKRFVSAGKQSGSHACKSTFATFVTGKGNELACVTARSVADDPGRYGPLLLFGPPGVGKTHLCQAMVQHLRRPGSRAHVVRLTAEQFTCEFLSALDRRGLPGFRQKYRSVDVLLIEDIQFLAGKNATLDELLHTMDTLCEHGKQVVLTSDRNPGLLQQLSGDLASRIAGGIAVPIELPDFATRRGVVKQLAVRLKVALDERVIELIATQVAGSARQLAGAINRLVATSMARKSSVTEELARATLADFVQQNTPSVRLSDIQRAVCEVFEVEPAKLKSSNKQRSVAEPRMVAMWLARKYTRAALGEISEYFGRRSHSTVLSAQKKVERLVSEGAEISVANRSCQVDEAIRQIEAVLRTA